MNKDKRNNIQLLGTLNNADESGIIANANQVYDANEDKSTQDVSKEHTERIKTLEDKENSMQTTLENITKTGEASAASNVTYNHNDSQLDASNVQQAIDEVRKRSNYNDGDSIIDFNTIHIITDNPEFAIAAVDANNKILYGIKADGQPCWGVGVPKVVRDYVDKQVNNILGTDDITETIDSLKEVEKFLSDFKNSDTLKTLLDTKANKVDVVFDISAYHATGGTLATYADLTAALGTNGKNIPQSLRKGGMSVKYVQSSDNKYVQYRLMSDTFNTTPANWQGVDDEPTAGSNNLVKSGGVYAKINELNLHINPLSDNQFFNDTIKEVYTAVDTTDVNRVQIAKAASYGNKYINLIRFFRTDNNEVVVFCDQSYNTQEEALANLKPFYVKNGNYCVIDWSKINVGQDYNANIVLNHECVANLEFNPYIAGYIQGRELESEIQKNTNDIKSLDLKINPLSNNQTFNDAIKEMYTSEDLSDVNRVQITKSVNTEWGCLNLIRLWKTDNNAVVFCAQSYNTQEEALANLKPFYVKNGNYCVIDWSKIDDGRDFNAGITLNSKFCTNLEFNPYIAGYIQGRELESEILNTNIAKNGNSNSLFKSGVADYQKPNTDIINFIIYGQSLSTGQQTCPELSRENYKGNLMIGQYEWIYGTGNNTRDSITPLKAVSVRGENYIPTNSSDQTNGETPNVNFANGAKCMLDGYILNLVDRKILACSCGSGGQSIELLSKNCPNNSGTRYNQFTTTLNTIKALADAENKTLSCGCIIWMQGEYNASAEENQGWQQNTPATNNKDDYKAYLLGGITSDGVTHNGLINDMIEDVLTIYQQNTQPIILCSQIGPGFNKAFDNPIDMALLEANNESDLITLVAPSYCVTDRSAHLDSNGTRWIGEYYNKVWYNKVVLGNDWKPLQPNKITKGKNYLDIRFDVPVPPLKFDTHLVRERPNYGFSVKSNGRSISISNIKIISNDTVRITSDTDFEGDVEVAYATTNVVYGNLRDSDPWQSFEEYKNLDEVVQNPEGVSYLPSWQPTDEEDNIIYNKKYPCYNWCLKFYYKILSSENVLNINT